MDAVVLLVGLFRREHAPGREAREPLPNVALGFFEGFDLLVASDYGVTGLGGEPDDAGAHRADAEDADGLVVVSVHYKSSFLESS